MINLIRLIHQNQKTQIEVLECALIQIQLDIVGITPVHKLRSIVPVRPVVDASKIVVDLLTDIIRYAFRCDIHLGVFLLLNIVTRKEPKCNIRHNNAC